MLAIVTDLGDDLVNRAPDLRDRDAEFVARGTVAELHARAAQVKQQPLRATARGALLHVLEELAQHHGHLEITRDLLRAGAYS